MRRKLSRKLKNTMRVIATLAILAFAFQQCGSLDTGFDNLASGDDGGSASLREIDQLQEPPPALVCGPNGYQYLTRNYIRTNCSACHSEFGPIPHAFTHSDPAIAFSEALGVSPTRWRATITHNRFCGPGCNLSTQGEVYAAFQEWLDNRTSCP